MQNLDFASNDALQPESSRNANAKTGLKLVLPPLSAVKALKGKKKGSKGVAFQDAAEPKIPRTLKLKPLKEVLVKLIAQIKKKDDYAFFLKPVDTSQIPGYLDVIKTPMDFGTISQKVDRGRYRSLEEFGNDVRLVTGNAKLFNPPGTIYHSEAERIEQYAVDHINRAAATVIEFEGDWNLDGAPEEDMEVQTAVEREEGRATPMDVDGSTRARSPSVSSVQTPLLRRGGKAKKQPGQLSENLEPDGHLPGYKDGVGIFPPGSEWSDLMLSLKLKGKRYRTKKERMRYEKSGPPYAADGSVDYTEMEDPFSVLQVLVPEPQTKPMLTPLYPSSDPQFPGPSTVPFYRADNDPKPKSKPSRPGKRKHWNIVRSAPVRRRDTALENEEEVPSWKVPREHHATDYGPFATIQERIAHEYGLQNIGQDLGSEAQLFPSIRRTVDRGITWNNPAFANDDLDLTEQGFWARRGKQAEDFVKDIVYGGIDGFAYVRSLAEFVDNLNPAYVDTSYAALGMPLRQYVEEAIIDPITDGRHRLLRGASKRLHDPSADVDPAISAHVDFALNVLPNAARQLVELRKISTHQLDMAALLHKPEELFLADSDWAGKKYVEEQKKQRLEERKRLEAQKEQALADGSAHPMQYLAFAIQSHEEEQSTEGPQPDTPAMLQYALNHAADLILQTAQTVQEAKRAEGDVKMEDTQGDGQEVEDPALKKLRLELLALAKRAPLDKLSRLPADLVPEPIRHMVPIVHRTEY